jgi:acyl carrier protein
MTLPLRATVIAALDSVTGVMNQPDTARALMAGGDLLFDTLDIDSLSLMEMVMALEDALGIELDGDEVAATRSVDGLVKFLAIRTAQG